MSPSPLDPRVKFGFEDKINQNSLSLYLFINSYVKFGFEDSTYQHILSAYFSIYFGFKFLFEDNSIQSILSSYFSINFNPDVSSIDPRVKLGFKDNTNQSRSHSYLQIRVGVRLLFEDNSPKNHHYVIKKLKKKF